MILSCVASDGQSIVRQDTCCYLTAVAGGVRSKPCEGGAFLLPGKRRQQRVRERARKAVPILSMLPKCQNRTDSHLAA